MCQVSLSSNISFHSLGHESSDVNVDRYYETDVALQSHWRSKVHKRQCKALKEPAYTIEEAERAAGLGREGKRPSTVSVVTEDVVV
jgi:U1-like Zn-finger-containing protein